MGRFIDEREEGTVRAHMEDRVKAHAERIARELAAGADKDDALTFLPGEEGRPGRQLAGATFGVGLADMVFETAERLGLEALADAVGDARAVGGAVRVELGTKEREQLARVERELTGWEDEFEAARQEMGETGSPQKGRKPKPAAPKRERKAKPERVGVTVPLNLHRTLMRLAKGTAAFPVVAAAKAVGAGDYIKAVTILPVPEAADALRDVAALALPLAPPASRWAKALEPLLMGA